MPVNNIDPTLAPAPMGLASLEEPMPDVEVELPVEEGQEPEDDGSLEVTLPGFDDNLLDLVTDEQRATLSGDVEHWVDEDRRSRDDWERTYREGLKLLGLQYEDRTEPWAGACGVTHPMITEAVVRFQSETIMETFPAAGPCNTKIVGEETPEKKAAAVRVRAEMNFQLTEKMIEYRSEHEKMLWNLSPVGCAFKKIYRDPTLGRQVSLFVPAEDVVMPYSASNIYASERVTHVMRKTENELASLQRLGFYSEAALLGTPYRMVDEIKQAKDEATGFSDITDIDSFTVYETQVSLVLTGIEEDETPRPYVVTKIRGGDMLSIRRNWREEDPLALRRHHFTQYDYIPGFGPYGYGLFHLIGGYAKASTSILRQLVDAGTIANLPGGLKTKGLRIKGDDVPIAPGEWRDVDVLSGVLRDNLLPLPYKEPSQTLLALLNQIIEEGRRLPGMADMKISDMSAEAPVGTTLALLERQLKVMSAVQARTHNSLKQELKLLKEVIADSGDDDYTYQTDAPQPGSKQADFAMVDVIPVSDPSAATMTQRVVQYQAVIQLSQQAPQVYDLPQLHRGMLEVLGIKDSAKLVPIPEEAKPTDPVTENMNIMMAKPVKAFPQQDHASHLAVHNAFLQDPKIQASLGQNPQAPQMTGAAQAHIAEHMAYQYKAQIEELGGTPLPDPMQPMEDQQAMQLAQQLAQAAQQAQAANAAEAQAQAAKQAAEDPMMKLQTRALDQRDRELSLKEREMQIKAADLADRAELDDKKLQVEATDKADKLDLQREKLVQTGELGEQNVRVKTLQVGMMGRAQDQKLLAEDRAAARADVDRMLVEHEANQIGVSRTPPTEPQSRSAGPPPPEPPAGKLIGQAGLPTATPPPGGPPPGGEPPPGGPPPGAPPGAPPGPPGAPPPPGPPPPGGEPPPGGAPPV